MMFFLSGCFAGTGMRTGKVNNTWRGHHIDRLIASWGAPNSAYKRQDGGGTYTWTQISHMSRMYICNKIFNTNSSGIITNSSWNGDCF